MYFLQKVALISDVPVFENLKHLADTLISAKNKLYKINISDSQPTGATQVYNFT